MKAVFGFWLTCPFVHLFLVVGLGVALARTAGAVPPGVARQGRGNLRAGELPHHAASGRNALDPDAKLVLYVEYVDHRKLDLLILWRTMGRAR